MFFHSLQCTIKCFNIFNHSGLLVSRKEEEKTNEKIDKCNGTQNEEDGNNEETKKVDEQNEQDIPVDIKKHLREAIKCANIVSMLLSSTNTRFFNLIHFAGNKAC